MSQQYGGGLTPRQQKQFSSWWLNEQYGGDLNNVEGLYQNETTGNWQADPGRVFDINPETGQKGQFKYMATPAYTGWMDVTPPLSYTITNADGSTFEVEMTRNRHGLYAPEEFLDSSGERIVFNTNPNTGEEGKWIWLGSMGWTNTEGDPQPEPEPGTLVFGGGGQMVGPYDPDYDSSAESGDAAMSESSAGESVSTGSDSASMGGGSASMGGEPASVGGESLSAGSGSVPMAGGYTASTPIGLNYQAQPLSALSASTGIDYAKLLNSALAVDVLGGMLTGRNMV